MRHTRSHTKNRRSHHALEGGAITVDETGTPHLRHRATKDGRYRGRQVIDVVAKVEKKLAKKKDSAENAR
jgi:ribosomal protein L32